MSKRRDGGPGEESDAADGHTQWRHVAQRRYEPAEAVELTTVIIYAVADAEDTDPAEITTPPLYEVADIAALETTLFAREGATTARRSTGTVEFRYRGFRVTVDSDGWVQVYEPTEPG